MKIALVVVIALVVGCSKKKSEDKATAPPASIEQSTGSAAPTGGAPPAPTPAMPDPAVPDPKAATPADEGGELERKMKTPADDGGEDKKPVPADDGGEAMQKACGKPEDCPGTHDCCNGFCFKKGSAKHSIECKLPAGKL